MIHIAITTKTNDPCADEANPSTHSPVESASIEIPATENSAIAHPNPIATGTNPIFKASGMFRKTIRTECTKIFQPSI